MRGFGEVYTQPREVNAMLDLVKEESYRTDSLFLEPACGNGNFLVEILKRKLSISKIKEDILTSLRSIYAIDILEDNIAESKKRLYELVKDNLTQEEAFFIMDQNVVCGDSLELLNHSPYIDMKFDVIIGNPPYQLNDGGHGASAMPLYHKFVQQAKKINPKYITMIIPSRWFTGGRALDSFRQEMLSDKRIKDLIDYPNASNCFPGVDIKGGVCYFLWDNNYNGLCTVRTIENGKESILKRALLDDNLNCFVRYNEAIPIIQKVNQDLRDNFSELISSQKPFGFRTFFVGNSEYKSGDVKIYGNKKISYIAKNQVFQNVEWIEKHKLFIPKAIGSGEISKDWVKPLKGYPGDICTETYVVCGPFELESEMLNAYSYIQTKFFHFMLSIKKNTQDASKRVYEGIPMQDFSKPWTDAELYEKYGLTQEEINYIEAVIRPMK